MTSQSVKNDIKEWRRIFRQISLLEGVSGKYKKRIEALKRIKTENSEREIERLQAACEGFRLKELKEREKVFRGKYQSYIDKLSPIDRLIINSYVSGASQSEISQDLGYSEIGIRKRLGKIYKKLEVALTKE